jgi:respiratory nitrate reductase gamma subunit
MDGLLFGAFPYVALTIFVIGTIVRYRGGFKYSSLSSQFLEAKKFSYGSVPFHVGILVVFFAHLVAFIFPGFTFGGSTLVTMETIMLAFSIMAIVGLLLLFIRRITTQRVNLFEKVKIPECLDNIRVIRIYLGDQQANAVGVSKVAKKKIEARIIEEVFA